MTDTVRRWRSQRCLLAGTLLAVASNACDLPTTDDTGAGDNEASTGPYIAQGPPYDMDAIRQAILDGRPLMIPVEPSPYLERVPGGGWRTVGIDPLAPGETRHYPDGSRSYRPIDNERPPWDLESGDPASPSDRGALGADSLPDRPRPTMRWSREDLASAPRWGVSAEPMFASVSEVTGEITDPRTGAVLRRQRHVVDAEFVDDGGVVLLYQVAPPDSVLLRFIHPARGEDATVLTPKGEGGAASSSTGLAMVSGAGGMALIQDRWPRTDRPARPAERAVWHVDRGGRFQRQPSVVTGGEFFGIHPDGSLVMVTAVRTADTTTVSSVVSLRLAEEGQEAFWAENHVALFRTDARRAVQKAVAVGDTIWIVPSESPELMALDRSGDVVVKIEWEVEHRDIPPERPGGAASRLLVGTNGLIYMQRWTVGRDRLSRSPEWLVVNASGELAARLDIPSHWRVLAFGDESVAAVVRNDEGLEEVRIHSLEEVR